MVAGTAKRAQILTAGLSILVIFCLNSLIFNSFWVRDFLVFYEIYQVYGEEVKVL